MIQHSPSLNELSVPHPGGHVHDGPRFATAHLRPAALEAGVEGLRSTWILAPAHGPNFEVPGPEEVGCFVGLVGGFVLYLFGLVLFFVVLFGVLCFPSFHLKKKKHLLFH